VANSFKVEFVWSGRDVQLGNLSQVRLDGQDLPWERVGGAPANWWLQLRHREAQRAGTFPSAATRVDAEHSLTQNENQCVTLPAGRFLYMDVGRWLNGNQDFGLIAGNNAYLCRYAPGAPLNQAPSGTVNTKAEDELLGLPGVSVQDHKKILDHFPRDPDHLYLILPDMHVTDCPTPDNPDFDKWRNSDGWEFMEKTDCIFHSRKSVSAMVEFLRRIRATRIASRITLVQIGDMYELWAGRNECYFQDLSDAEYMDAVSKNECAVRLRDIQLNDDTTESSAPEIGLWIAQTHDRNYPLFSEFDACMAVLADCRFLYGNHDSYLAVRRVVDEANQATKDLFSKEFTPPSFGSPKGGSIPRATTKVYYREKEVFLDGVFIEHGQRYDWANRDGHKYGYDKTNSAVNFPYQVLKVFDSNRHPTFVFGAAATWALSHKKFGLFVQGHTHDPVLKYVDVANVRSDKRWVPVGKGVRAEVEIKSPL
jgi:hypothetical protein